MNWLTNFVRPKIQKLVRPKEVPDNLWNQCPKCSEMVFHRELEKNLLIVLETFVQLLSVFVRQFLQ